MPKAYLSIDILCIFSPGLISSVYFGETVQIGPIGHSMKTKNHSRTIGNCGSNQWLNSMRRRLTTGLIFISFLFSERIYGQNLLANGSFEDSNSCYEFKANCSPAAWFAVFSKDPYQIKPVTGNRSLTFTFGNINDQLLKTYPYTRILCPLLPGTEYRLKVWINCGDFDFTHLDVLLTKQDPTRIRRSFEKPVFSFQLKRENIQSIRKDHWVLLEKTFSVPEERNFILLGDISNEQYPKSFIKTAKKKNGNIIFSIDDIYLTGPDSSANKCDQYNDVIAMLYAETHRHTSQIYLDISKSTPKVNELGKKEEISGDLSESYSVKNNTPYKITIPGILFKSGSSEIDIHYKNILDSAFNSIQRLKIHKIELNGYTDNIGSKKNNKELSMARAKSIESVLVQKLPGLRNVLYSNGFGMENPVAPNDNETNRAKNRRVEILIFGE